MEDEDVKQLCIAITQVAVQILRSVPPEYRAQMIAQLVKHIQREIP